jgi:hypothetical protein
LQDDKAVLTSPYGWLAAPERLCGLNSCHLAGLNSNAPAAAAPRGVGRRRYRHAGGGESPNNGLRPSLRLVATRGVLEKHVTSSRLELENIKKTYI